MPKEGTCPFCEKEADDLMTVLLEKEKRGEKVIWDDSLDEYDPNTLYGDRTELNGNEVVIHGDAKLGQVTIPPSDINPSTLEKIERRVATMGICSDSVEMPDLKDRRVDERGNNQPFVNHPYLELQGYAPNPNKSPKLPHFRTMVNPWFDIDNDSHNEKQECSISSEKPIIDIVTLKDVLPERNYNELLKEPMMRDVAILEEEKPITEVKFMAVDNFDLMMVKTDPRDLDEDNFDDTLFALKHIHQSTGSIFTDTPNAQLRGGKSVEKAIQYLTTYGGYEKVGVRSDIPEEKSENDDSRSISDDFVETKVIPITVEAIRAVRQATSEGMAYCKKILQKCGGHIDKAIEEIKKHPPRRPLMGKVEMVDETEET